jgi:tRNA G18 (ribose-2'-O)-methylase SpoU
MVHPIKTDFNVRDDLKHLPFEEIRAVQDNQRLPYAIALCNLNGDLNVGTSIRSAAIFSAERVFIFGKRRFDCRSTVGTQNYVDVVRVGCDIIDNDVDRSVFDMTIANYDYTPIFIETGGTDISVVDWKTVHRPCLIFGNEGYGMSKEFISDGICVRIPQRGVNRSLNVGTAVGISCFVISQHLG